MYNALSVLVYDKRIGAWLVKHDPQALTQARNALAQYAAEQNEVLNQLVEDDHCESDGSSTCLIHFGQFVAVSDGSDLCDLSPRYDSIMNLDVYVGPLNED
jgi:hypothetical protein